MKHRYHLTTRRFGILATQLFLGLSALYWLLPLFRKPLVREDNLMEMATALLFLLTAVLGFSYLLRKQKANRHWSEWVVPGLATLGFLEEVSFGRLFFEKLPIVEGVKIDAIHDYLRVIINLYHSGDHSQTFLGIALAVAVISLAIVQLYYRNLVSFIMRLPVRFCMICLSLVAVASALDLELFQHHYLVFMEEFLEMLAALALWFGYRNLPSFDNYPISEASGVVGKNYSQATSKSVGVGLDA